MNKTLLMSKRNTVIYGILTVASLCLPPEITTLARQQWWRGGEHRDFNMWFRDAQAQDAALLDALHAPQGECVRISSLIDEVTGAVVLRGLDAQTDELSWLSLLPEHRGRGLSAQLLGEAISLARRMERSRSAVNSEPSGKAANGVSAWCRNGPMPIMSGSSSCKKRISATRFSVV